MKMQEMLKHLWFVRGITELLPCLLWAQSSLNKQWQYFWNQSISQFLQSTVNATCKSKCSLKSPKKLVTLSTPRPFSSSRCWSDHGPQTERAAATAGRCHGNGSGPEATPDVDGHRWVELQGWLWAPRLLSVYSGSRVKFRARHDDVKAGGERSSYLKLHGSHWDVRKGRRGETEKFRPPTCNRGQIKTLNPSDTDAFGRAQLAQRAASLCFQSLCSGSG